MQDNNSYKQVTSFIKSRLPAKSSHASAFSTHTIFILSRSLTSAESVSAQNLQPRFSIRRARTLELDPAFLRSLRQGQSTSSES